MALELVGGAALGAVFEKLFTAVGDATKKATQFDSRLKKLDGRLKTIRPTIQETERLNDQLNRPKKEMETLIQILKDGEKLIHKCTKVSCCNYYKKWRYANKIEALQVSLLEFFQVELQIQNNRNQTEMVVLLRSDRIRGVSGNYESLGSCEAPKPPAFMVGLDVRLQELKNLLLTDRESRIVVSAPGGCGKTTLAKRLCHDPQVKEYFTLISYVTVSQTFDLIGIIKKLFRHNDENVPGFVNEDDAVNQLELMLQRKVESGRKLLVLDDVWSGSESVLGKFKTIPGYKVLVTSRYEFRDFGSTYHLKLLSEEDAKTLFRHSAVPEEGTSSSMPGEDLMNKIVRCCKGFPLALEVVGRSLHLQSVETWRSTLIKLSEGQSSVNSEYDELRNCLQSSLDALDDKDNMLKECFMDLGSFPEDQKIPATALIDMWAELYKLDKDGIYAISNLHKLCSRNLLNLVVTRNDANEIESCYNDAFALQHDLLRDLAIYLSNQEPIERRKRLIVDLTGLTSGKLPEWWTEEEQPQLGARLVSISTGENFSSGWCNMQIPEAEVLILNFNQTEKKHELPEFMKQMGKLKVLVVTNYGFCAAELTNFSVFGSLSNLKRIRLEQVSIPTLCNTSMELKNLEKLSLVMCHKFGQAFASSTIQIPEMLPNLREINIDYSNDLVQLPEGFCDLVQLNKLSISNCHKLSALPEGIGGLANLEVLRVRACTSVSKLPESIGSLHKLRVLDISGCLRVRKMPAKIGELRSLREFHMRRCPGLRELPSSVTDLVDLERVICDEETAQLWERFKHLLSNLTLSVPEETIDLNWL